jgi:hypothetical protein
MAMSAAPSTPASASPATDPQVPQWTNEAGGNGHFYQRVDETGPTFEQASRAAATMRFNGLPGHLVVFETPAYNAEVTFVHDRIYAPGVSSGRAYWVGAVEFEPPAS